MKVLAISTNTGDARAYLADEGAAVEAASNDPREYLGQLLINFGHLGVPVFFVLSGFVMAFTVQAETVDRTPRDGAKNRPTPKRKDQEAARRQPLVVADRKQAKQLDKARRNEQLAKTRQAMISGDDAGLPARDKGPVRRYMRDYIDARWNLAEFMLPVMLIVLALSFMRTSTILFFVTILTYSVLLFAVVDTFLMYRGVRKRVAAKFGDDAALAKGTSPAVAGKAAFSEQGLGCASCHGDLAQGDPVGLVCAAGERPGHQPSVGTVVGAGTALATAADRRLPGAWREGSRP